MKGYKQRMSQPEVTMPTLPQLQQEYAKLAQIYGDLTYRITCMNEDASQLVLKMKDVNQKAALIPKDPPKEVPAKAVEGEVV